MKLHGSIIMILGGVMLLGASCTGRRTDSVPEADGDTIEVVIPGKETNHRERSLPADSDTVVSRLVD